jgi:predicted DNA-binding transcriptional regulator AlpA
MSRTKQTAFSESGTSPSVSRENSFAESGTSPTLRVLTVEQVANLLQVSPSSIYEMTRYRGTRNTAPLSHKKVGRYLRFLSLEVEAWLLDQPHAVNAHKRSYRRGAARTQAGQ